MATTQERAELHKTIWKIANDLRGSVDGWEFKAYVLGSIFYRFISENICDYIQELMQMYASSAGKSGGEFFTPQQVSELLARLASWNNPNIQKVYDPACGSGSLLLKFAKTIGRENPNLKYFGQEINPTTYNLCRINMFLHNGRNLFQKVNEDICVKEILLSFCHRMYILSHVSQTGDCRAKTSSSLPLSSLRHNARCVTYERVPRHASSAGLVPVLLAPPNVRLTTGGCSSSVLSACGGYSQVIVLYSYFIYG